MAFVAPLNTEVVEPSSRTFPGLKCQADADAPSIRVCNGMNDIYDALKMCSPGVKHNTLSSRFTSSITTLKSAVGVTERHMGTAVDILDTSSDAEIAGVCGTLSRKDAMDLEKSVGLLRNMPPNDVAWLRWKGDRTGPRMLVTNTFLKSFITEFVSTPLSFKLKADLIHQHTLNEAATTEHVVNMAARNAQTSGTHYQAAALTGTGHVPDVGVSLNAHSTNAPAGADHAITLIGLMNDGEARTAMIVRELKATREAREREAEAAREVRRREEDARERRAEEEHQRALVVYDEKIATIRRESKQKDLMYKQKLDEYNEEKKKRKIGELTHQLENTHDEATRRALNERLELTRQIPTETTFVVRNDRIEKPQRLQQQVLVNDGSAMEFRFPAGTMLMDAALESRVTIREYIDRVYPTAKLSNDDLKRLGGIVAKTVQQHNPAAANLVMRKVVDGERYAPRTYFMRDLDGPPLDDMIESFVKEHASESTPSVTGAKRKRDTPNHTIESWFAKAVVGTPVG